MKKLPVLFASLLFVSCGSKELEDKQFRASNTPLKMSTIKAAAIGSEVDVGQATNFQFHGDSFTFVDLAVGQKCYQYNADGTFKRVIGGKGQGPGEYMMPTACTISGSRIWVSGGGDQQFHLYDLDGNFIKRTAKEVKGLSTTMVPGDNGDIIEATFSRYSGHIFHQYDANGVLLNEFGKTPEMYALSFDTFSPAGSVLFRDDLLYQGFNFAYEVHVYDLNGAKKETIRLASIRYMPPNLSKARTTKGHKGEIEFRGSFTQFNGVHSYKNGFVTLLTGWKDKRTEQSCLEFWDKEFRGLGYYEMVEGESFLGVINDHLVFFGENKENPAIVYRTVQGQSG